MGLCYTASKYDATSGSMSSSCFLKSKLPILHPRSICCDKQKGNSFWGSHFASPSTRIPHSDTHNIHLFSNFTKLVRISSRQIFINKTLFMQHEGSLRFIYRVFLVLCENNYLRILKEASAYAPVTFIFGYPPFQQLTTNFCGQVQINANEKHRGLFN